MSKTPIEVYDEEIRSGASLFEGIDAVAAHARREALEEAAKIAEDGWLGTELTKTYFNDLATAIRALLNVSPGSGGQEQKAYWLIERGSPAEWWAGTDRPATEHWTKDVSKVHPLLRFETREAAKGEAERIRYFPTVIGSVIRVTEHIDCAGPALDSHEPPAGRRSSPPGTRAGPWGC